MDRENVDQICRRRHKSHQQAEPNEARGYYRSHELHLGLNSPAVHEEADGHNKAADCHDMEAVFGLEVTFCDVLCHCLVAEVGADQLAGQ